MTNERYLIISYFVCAGFSVALGTLVYFFLRPSFDDIARTASGKQLRLPLKRIFPLGIVLPALLGFVSVSYRSCSHATYKTIVQDRSYLVERNREQIFWILLSILVAVLFWDAVILLVMKFTQSGRKSSS